MDILIQCASAISHWVYTLFNVNIPLLNVTFWELQLTIFAIILFLRVTDVVTHRNMSSGSQDNNNNRIYKE